MKKILLIDDLESLRKMLSRLLEQSGYEVKTAEDGKKGVELFKEYGPDLVITDLIMPDKDGIETTVALRKIDPDVKIILMSGGGAGGSGKEYLDDSSKVLSLSHIIAKPFENAEFLNLVQEVLA